jgi:hypothetical protein
VKNKFFIISLILSFLFTTNLKSNDQFDKLKILLEKGLITESEFKKAIQLTDNRDSKIDIRKISGKSGREKFEKYEFYIDNYRVHTLGPGTIRIDNLLTGETDVTLTGNFKTKFTRNGKKFFKFEFNEEELKSNLLYKGKVLINWTARYVRRYQATFHQMQVLGYQPFHYYIVLPGKNPIALNFNLFNKKIEKAVAKVKQELSIKYNLSISDIDRIMEKKENVVSKEQEKIIKELTEKYAGKEITDAIRQEIEKTIGEEMANAFISEIEQYTGQAIDKAVEQELASAINEAISYAVQQGVSEATAAAAIEAMIIVYALGGTDEDAMEACRSIAGDAC